APVAEAPKMPEAKPTKGAAKDVAAEALVAPPADSAEVTVRGGGKSHAGANAESLLEAKEPLLRKCLAKGDRVSIRVLVDATGKATPTIDGASSDKVKTCLVGVLGTLKMPAVKASVSITIENSNR